MFARAKHKNVSLCQYAPVPPVEKNLPDALALTDNELCKEMALNWKCEHLHKKHFVKPFFLETPTLFELEVIKLNM